MKKGILLLTAFAAFGIINAQTITQLENPKSQETIKTEPIDFSRTTGINKRAESEQWFSPVSAIYGTTGKQLSGSFFRMRQDSNLVSITKDTDTEKKNISHFGVHSLGMVFDPKDELFSFDQNAPQLASQFTNYILDSISFDYYYFRPLDSMKVGGVLTEVVDTLYIQLYKASDLSLGTFTWNEQATEHKGEQEFYGTPISINTKTAMATKASQVIAIPLTSLDSTQIVDNKIMAKSIDLDVNLAIAAGNMTPTANVCGFSYTFRSMKPTVFGDTLYNSFDNPDSMYNGISSLHNSFGGTIAVNENEDYLQQSGTNNLFFSNTTTLYHGGKNGFLKQYLPGHIFNNRYYLRASMKITSDNISVKDIDANGFGIGEAYPNPANEGTEINVDVEFGTPTAATIRIMDMSGKIINATNVEQMQGPKTITLATGTLSAGMYLYSVEAGNFTATKKFIIK